VEIDSVYFESYLIHRSDIDAQQVSEHVFEHEIKYPTMFPINGKFDGISPDLDLMDQYLSLKISIYHQGHIQHTMHSKTRTVLYTKVIYLSDIPSGSNEWRKDLIPLNSTDGIISKINMIHVQMRFNRPAIPQVLKFDGKSNVLAITVLQARGLRATKGCSMDPIINIVIENNKTISKW